jgi:hypothetical protein
MSSRHHRRHHHHPRTAAAGTGSPAAGRWSTRIRSRRRRGGGSRPGGAQASAPLRALGSSSELGGQMSYTATYYSALMFWSGFTQGARRGRGRATCSRPAGSTGMLVAMHACECASRPALGNHHCIRTRETAIRRGCLPAFQSGNAPRNQAR